MVVLSCQSQTIVSRLKTKYVRFNTTDFQQYSVNTVRYHMNMPEVRRLRERELNLGNGKWIFNLEVFGLRPFLVQKNVRISFDVKGKRIN